MRIRLNRLDIVLLLLIIINIINYLYPKGQGIELQHRWEDNIVYFLYAGVISLMLPSLFVRVRYFSCMCFMSWMILFYIIYAYTDGDKFNQNVVIRTFMVACSFVFFEEEIYKRKINIQLCRLYALTLFIQYSILIISENRLMTAVLNVHTVGGQSLANSVVFILPLIFYLFKSKTSTIFYLAGFIVVFISLRRTAIITYLLMLPFIYKKIVQSVSRKQAFLFLLVLCVAVFFIISKYRIIIEMRFLNLYEANSEGEYGSGRTGWLIVLLKEFVSSPKNWLQGFGLGAVSKSMSLHGYPFGHAHNGYVEILYTYGLIGFCLWFYAFVKIAVVAKKNAFRYNLKLILYLCSFLFFLISVMSGTTFLPSVLAISLCVNMIIYKDKCHVAKNEGYS